MLQKEKSQIGPLRVLALVDEANLLAAARNLNKWLDWDKFRSFLANDQADRQLVEMIVYVGLPPANMPEFQKTRDKKLGWVHRLRTQGFMVVTKDGSPRESPKFKANVDVLMAIDAIDLAGQIHPDVVILVTGDADFAHLALTLRRHGIRVEVAALENSLSNDLRAAANKVIDLKELFNQFETIHGTDRARLGAEGDMS